MLGNVADAGLQARALHIAARAIQAVVRHRVAARAVAITRPVAVKAARSIPAGIVAVIGAAGADD